VLGGHVSLAFLCQSQPVETALVYTFNFRRFNVSRVFQFVRLYCPDDRFDVDLGARKLYASLFSISSTVSFINSRRIKEKSDGLSVNYIANRSFLRHAYCKRTVRVPPYVIARVTYRRLNRFRRSAERVYIYSALNDSRKILTNFWPCTLLFRINESVSDTVFAFALRARIAVFPNMYVRRIRASRTGRSAHYQFEAW